MGIKLLILAVLMLSFSKVFAQENFTLQKDVAEFWKTVDEKGLSAPNGKFPKENIRDIAQKLLDAVRNSPRNFDSSISIKHEWIKEEYKRTGNRDLIPAGAMVKIVSRRIGEYYGENFAHTIRTPYYLRVKVLRKTDTVYYSADIKRNILCRKYTCKVEDVLKGEKTLKDGDIVDLAFLPAWIEEGPIMDIKEGAAYFIGATVSDNMLSLLISMNDQRTLSVYPIINETIEIPDDYWKLGKVNSWESFRSAFLSRYNMETIK